MSAQIRASAALVAAIVLAALLGPVLWTADPLLTDLPVRFAGLGAAHPLGTDQFGRDLLARVLQGARLSLAGSAVVLAGCCGIGLLVGGLAGLVGGRLDRAVGRLVDALLALPSLVVALAVVGAVGRSFAHLVAALVVTGWPWYARVFRSLVIAERHEGYVLAAVSTGCRLRRIALVHVLPNILGTSVVVAAANLGGALLGLTSLSFLGLGVQPPEPEWGAMITDSRAYFQTHPWTMIVPGVAIGLTVLSVNLLGDALRDLADQRTGVARREV